MQKLQVTESRCDGRRFVHILKPSPAVLSMVKHYFYAVQKDPLFFLQFAERQQITIESFLQRYPEQEEAEVRKLEAYLTDNYWQTVRQGA